MDGDLVRGLRSRGVDVVTAIEARMICRSDEDHLRLASTQGRVLYSFNVRDFQRIHSEWVVHGEEHAGILVAQQRRYSTGDQIRRMVRFIGTISREAMKNRMEFLGNW